MQCIFTGCSLPLDCNLPLQEDSTLNLNTYLALIKVEVYDLVEFDTHNVYFHLIYGGSLLYPIARDQNFFYPGFTNADWLKLG